MIIMKIVHDSWFRLDTNLPQFGEVYGLFFHRNDGETSYKLPTNDAGNPINFMVAF